MIKFSVENSYRQYWQIDLYDRGKISYCRFLPFFLLVATLTGVCDIAFSRESLNGSKLVRKELVSDQNLADWAAIDFRGHGYVSVSDGSIILTRGSGATGVKWRGEFPRVDYELQLEAMRVRGSDFFCGLTFPVDNEFCSLIIGGWGGNVVGLSSIDGDDAFQNATGTMQRFRNGQWYHIKLMVKKDTIRAWIDNKCIVDFQRYDETLSIRPEVELCKPFGITCWKSTAAVRKMYLMKMDGDK